MDLNKLQYVVMVADEQSFSRAAKKLFISQPSLSQSIQSIEKQLGVELFDRQKTPLQLTDAGGTYVEWAKKTLNSSEQMRKKISEISEGHRRKLTIGLSAQRCALLMPEVICRFYDKAPGCNVIVNEKWNIELFGMLESGVCDIIIGTPHPDTVHYANVPLVRERLLLAASEQFYIPCKDNIPFPIVDKSVLIDKPLIMLHEEQYLGQVFRTLVDEINHTAPRVTICGNLETVHNLAAKGVGVTLLPEVSIFGRQLHNMKYYTFQNNDLTRIISVVYSRTRYFSKDARCFIDVLKDYLKTCDYCFDMIEMTPTNIERQKIYGRRKQK